MQKTFWLGALIGNLCWIGLLVLGVPAALWLAAPIITLTALGIYDLFYSPHTLNRLYPIAAYIRYFLEDFRPEIRQYFIASNTSELPFNREMRSLVYARAKGERDTLAFGTERDLMATGFMTVRHSIAPKKPSELGSRVIVGNGECRQPYSASRFNISAMSFGALSANAISALNLGAKKGNFAHNTGEGGISAYHRLGGDIIWQIGTGYFGCRNPDGGFDVEKFAQKAQDSAVKMIEIKISQGAKPAHGGILPAAKITKEIAVIRGIPMAKSCISPPSHSMFSNPIELLEFVDQLRKLSGAKPVGFKLCIGNHSEFMGICKAMLETEIYPDFITIDGKEGGTGAAPLEFSNRIGMTCIEATHFVHNCLIGVNLRDQVKIISAGKTASGFEILEKIAVGADMVSSARTMMFALGCIQSQSCNTNMCPTGVATQDPVRGKALNVPAKAERVYNYHKATVKSFLDIMGAMGIEDPDQLEPKHLYRRMDDGSSKRYDLIYPSLNAGELLTQSVHEDFAEDWKNASSKKF